MVADPLGKLYNKDAIIEYLLDRTSFGDGDQICGYVKGVKVSRDTHSSIPGAVQLTFDPACLLTCLLSGPDQPERHPQSDLLDLFPSWRIRTIYQQGSRRHRPVPLYLPVDDEGDDRSAPVRSRPTLRLRVQ